MPKDKLLSSNRFRFKANPLWEDEDIVRAVARIVQNTEEFFGQPSGSGYKWMLGGSNNWWMDKDSQTGEFILAWRYCGGGNTVYMQLLYHVILWRLGIGHFNEEAKAKMGRQERLEWLEQYFQVFLTDATITPFDSDVIKALRVLKEKYKNE